MLDDNGDADLDDDNDDVDLDDVQNSPHCRLACAQNGTWPPH